MRNQRFSQLHSLLTLVKDLPSKIWMMHPAAGASAWHTQLAHVRCSLFVPMGFDARNPRCALLQPNHEAKRGTKPRPPRRFARFASIARKLKRLEWLEVLKCKLFWDTAMCSIKSHWMAWHLGKPLVQSPIDHSKFLLHRVCSSITLGLAGKILVSDMMTTSKLVFPICFSNP